MKKVLGITLSCLAVVVLLIVVIALKRDNENKVTIDDFADKEMGELILFNARIDEDMNLRPQDSVRMEHVEHIKELNIGYTGYYETLTDIEKCKNIEMLIIGSPIGVRPHYRGRLSGTTEPESAEKIIRVENELETILRNCPLLRELHIYNSEGTCDLGSLAFIEYGKNLEWLSLENMGDVDYSKILECSNLKTLDLWGCQISELGNVSKLEQLTVIALNETQIAEAGDIPNMKQLEVLMIEDTPLAENEEELALIYEAFPDIEIYK